jgi:hypothetical protein
MKRLPILTALVLASTIITGCAVTNETAVIVGQTRPATTPDQVKLYTKPPAKYEEIALISSDAAHDFMSKQALMEKSVALIKEQAAKVGANGVLIDSLGDFNVGSSGVMIIPGAAPGGMTIGTGAMNARTGKKVTGMAIFVSQEK